MPNLGVSRYREIDMALVLDATNTAKLGFFCFSVSLLIF